MRALLLSLLLAGCSAQVSTEPACEVLSQDPGGLWIALDAPNPIPDSCTAHGPGVYNCYWLTCVPLKRDHACACKTPAELGFGR